MPEIWSVIKPTMRLGLVMLALAVIASCGRRERGAEAKAAAPAVPVRVATAIVEEVSLTIEVTGSFVAEESSDLAPRVAGRVLATPVEVGDYVRRGDPVVVLDPTDQQLVVRQAEASFQQARAAVAEAQAAIGLQPGAPFQVERVPTVRAALANWEAAEAQVARAQAEEARYAALVETGDVSRSAFEQTRTQARAAEASARAAREQYQAALDSARQAYEAVKTAQAAAEAARAALEIVRRDLANTVIRAPFNGSVTARPVSVGEWVALTTNAATLTRLQPIRLQLLIPERHSGQVRLGMTASARVDAYPNHDFTGKVTIINAAVDPQSRTFLVEAEFENTDGALRPGMFAVANLLLPQSERAVFVPPSALLFETETESRQVYVIENGKARVRVVQIGKAGANGMIRVLFGLSGGELVATSNLERLYDQAPVRIEASS